MVTSALATHSIFLHALAWQEPKEAGRGGNLYNLHEDLLERPTKTGGKRETTSPTATTNGNDSNQQGSRPMGHTAQLHGTNSRDRWQHNLIRSEPTEQNDTARKAETNICGHANIKTETKRNSCIKSNCPPPKATATTTRQRHEQRGQNLVKMNSKMKRQKM